MDTWTQKRGNFTLRKKREKKMQCLIPVIKRKTYGTVNQKSFKINLRNLRNIRNITKGDLDPK